MSERGAFRSTPHRGRGTAPRGRGSSHADTHTHTTTTAPPERPKKENILDLSRHKDKLINVKFSGGREVIGTLKGHDQLLNLVLDDVREMLYDEETGETGERALGLVVARGTLLTSICPVEGREEIENPFGGGVEEGDED